MKIINHTSGTIILPTRHKLRPGENKGVPQSVRLHTDNVAFLNGEERAGRISYGDAVAAPTPPPEQGREAVAPVWNGGEVTRTMLAKMRKEELLRVGEKLGGLSADDMDGLNVEDGPKGEGLRTVVAAAVLGEL